MLFNVAATTTVITGVKSLRIMNVCNEMAKGLSRSCANSTCDTKKKMLSDNAIGRLRTARPTTVVRLPQEANVLKCSCRLRAHRDYYLTIPSTEISDRGVKLTTHLHTMQSLTICGAKPPLPMFLNGEHKELQAK
jgi:hypothetical protein